MHVTIDLFTKNDEILSKLSKYWLEVLEGGEERDIIGKGGATDGWKWTVGGERKEIGGKREALRGRAV